MRYDVIDISGDIGIKAHGEDCARAFVNAAAGMYSLITDVEKIEEKLDITVEVASDSPEGLLVGYLNELIFRFDTYGFICRRIEIQEFSLKPDAILRAKAYGEEFDADRHERKLLVKAATYHNIKVAAVDGRCEIEVIFDI